ncbi:pilin [Patescibacteria group bacterium]|nr:pilin [Patescibacteria group bacterium]MBU1683202.1 pilin [Patescibacteria group bacterium]
MTKLLKKTVSLVVSALFIGIFAAPAVFAATECDEDGDGYIVVPAATMLIIDAGSTYDADGDYNAVQWESFFNTFSDAQEDGTILTEEEECLALNFKKGAEPARCDEPLIAEDSGVYDPAKVTTVSGSEVNPGAFDQPGNGIDEDCNGADGELVVTAGGETDLGGLVEKTITLLSRAVVIISIIVLIWGGILYSTAAGDEQKTSKARKAIIGAVIGLIVGLLAPSIVSYITSSLV